MAGVQSLHNYIRTHRKRAGFTQAEIAFLLGCAHRSKVSRYERGVRIPSLPTAIALEILFANSIATLYAGVYEKKREEIRERARALSRKLDAGPFTPTTKQKLDALVDLIHPQRTRGTA